MADSILVLNAGSSSIKFSLFVERGGGLDVGLHGQVEGLYASPRFIAKDASGSTVGEKSWSEGAQFDHERALDYLFGFIRGELSGFRLAGIGHRVVHGGLEYTRPVRVDAGVLARLDKFVPLAPLHQPHNLTPIRLLLARQPGVPQVACFDTSFHRTNPEISQRFAIPEERHDAGVRRCGFHGLSYE